MSMPAYGTIFILLGLVPAVFAEEKLVSTVYPVADLVIPINDAGIASTPTLTTKEPSGGTTACGTQKQLSHAQALSTLVTTMVKPDSWAKTGGRGDIEYYPVGHALVVRQTADVQAEIAKLLESLRKLQDVQIAMEFCFMRIDDAMWERFGLDAEMPKPYGTTRTIGDDGFERIGVDFTKPTSRPDKLCWNAKQVHRFTEAVQGDRRTNIMQAPKLTTFNGQTATLQVGQTQTFVTDMKRIEKNGQTIMVPVNQSLFIGTACEAQAVVIGDGKEVSLRFKATISEPLGPTALFPVTTQISPVQQDGVKGTAIPFTQYIEKPRIETLKLEKCATISSGSTLIVHAGSFEREARSETNVPLLSKVPYVNRLFRNVGFGKVTEHIVVLITPRVLVAESANVDGSLGNGLGALVGTACADTCASEKASKAKPTCCEAAVKASCCLEAAKRDRKESMNLADVVALVSSGVCDEIVLTQMHTTGATFVLSTEDILWLKKNNVSDRIVLDMQHSRMRNAATVMPVFVERTYHNTPSPSPHCPPEFRNYPVPPPLLPQTRPLYSEYAPWMPPPMMPGTPATRPTPAPLPIQPVEYRFTPAAPPQLLLPPVRSSAPLPVPQQLSVPTLSPTPMYLPTPPLSRNQAAGEVGEWIQATAVEFLSGVTDFLGAVPEAFSEKGVLGQGRLMLSVTVKLENKYSRDPNVQMRQLLSNESDDAKTSGAARTSFGGLKNASATTPR